MRATPFICKNKYLLALDSWNQLHLTLYSWEWTLENYFRNQAYFVFNLSYNNSKAIQCVLKLMGFSLSRLLFCLSCILKGDWCKTCIFMMFYSYEWSLGMFAAIDRKCRTTECSGHSRWKWTVSLNDTHSVLHELLHFIKGKPKYF